MAKTPVVYMTFDRDTKTVLVDQSGYGNNGTANSGSVPLLTLNGTAARELNGINDYLKIISTVTTSTTAPRITIAAYINTRSLTGADEIIASRYWNAYVIKIIGTSEKVTYGICTDDNYHLYTGDTVLQDNTTYFFAVTYDGTHMQGYINGVPDGAGLNFNGNALTKTNNDWYLGAYADMQTYAPIEYYSFYLYNSSLNASEISELYRNEAWRASPTIGDLMIASATRGTQFVINRSYNPRTVLFIDVPSNCMARTLNSTITFTNVSLRINSVSNVAISSIRCVNDYSPSYRNYNQFLIDGSCVNITLNSCGVEKSRLQGQSFLIRPLDARMITLRDCHVNDTDDFGFDVVAVNNSDRYLFDSMFINCTADYCGYYTRDNDWVVGYDMADGIENLHISNNTYKNCSASHNWESGFYMEAPTLINRTYLIDCTSSYNGINPSPNYGYGFIIHHTIAINCSAENNYQGYGIYDWVASKQDPQVLESCREFNSTARAVYIAGQLTEGLAGSGVLIKNFTSDRSKNDPISINDIQNVTIINYTITNPGSYISVGSNTYGKVSNSTFDFHYYAPNGAYSSVRGWAPFAAVFTYCSNITISGYYGLRNATGWASAIRIDNCGNTDVRNVTLSGANTNGIDIMNIDQAKGQRVTLRNLNISYASSDYSNAAVFVESTATGAVISDTFSVKINSARPYKSNGNLILYTAGMTANNTSGSFPLSVQFYDNSMSFDPITAWKWTFGDNSSSSFERNPVHVYNCDGNYTVTLTAYTMYGESTISQNLNDITIAPSPPLPGTYTLSLVEGWNLIELPVMPENTGIQAIFPVNVIDGIVDIWGWDAAEQNWMYYSPNAGDYFYSYYPALTSMEAGNAYWVEMNKPASFTITGTVPRDAPASPAPRVSGWNLIGLTGLSTYAVSEMYPNALDIWGWDAAKQNWVYYSPEPADYFYKYYDKIESIQPGYGYWVEIA